MRVMLCYVDTGPFSAGGVGGRRKAGKVYVWRGRLHVVGVGGYELRSEGLREG